MTAPILRPMARPQQLKEGRAGRLCECGEHAFARLTEGFVVFVSPEDVCILMDRHWEAFRPVRGGRYAMWQRVRMHRVIMRCSASEIVDHIDGDGLNNRRSNLRLVTHSENCRNRRPKIRKTCPYKGVRERPNGFSAEIAFQETRRYLGQFETALEAAAAYDAAAIEMHGPFARTNAMLGLMSQQSNPSAQFRRK
jgi:hypothetical protein